MRYDYNMLWYVFIYGCENVEKKIETGVFK